MVRRTSRSWLNNATIVQCQDNHFVDFRLQVTPMSQERPHNLRRRRFLQQTPGEFIPRNLYPFCKLKDLLSSQIPSSEERKQHHEAIGSHKKLQWQALHDCFAVSEFLKRVVAASFFPVGWNRAAVNKPKPTQDFLPAIALRCEPLYPATLDCSDQFAARVTPRQPLNSCTLMRSLPAISAIRTSSLEASGPRGVSEAALAARPVSPGLGIHREHRPPETRA